MRQPFGGLLQVFRRVLAIPLNKVVHACFRAVLPDNLFNDLLFLILSYRTGFFRVLYCSTNTDNGFCGGGSRVCLTSSGCRLLQRMGAGGYLRDAVSAHTPSDTNPNGMDDCFGGQAYTMEPL